MPNTRTRLTKIEQALAVSGNTFWIDLIVLRCYGYENYFQSQEEADAFNDYCIAQEKLPSRSRTAQIIAIDKQRIEQMMPKFKAFHLNAKMNSVAQAGACSRSQPLIIEN